MNDLVERLRESATAWANEIDTRVEAASEIERLRAELSMLRNQEPVDWQYRSFHGYNTVNPGWGEWEKVLPRNPHTDTQMDRVTEIQHYIDQGYKYEVRALFAAPTPGEMK